MSWPKIKKIIFKYYIQLILIGILFFSFITKVERLGKIQEHIFDEVYVGFTAEQFALGNRQAWVWDYSAPTGFAYCWSHPPLGKLIMAGGIKILGVNSFSRRIVPALAGTLLSLMVFLLAKQIFPKRPAIGLLAATFIALDGLVLTLSRIGLADTILALFLLISIYFLNQKKYLYSAIFWGMALATKWTSFYFLPFLGLFLLSELKWQKNFKLLFKNLIYIIKVFLIYSLCGVIIYLLSYLPLFLYGYGFPKFIHLQQQMYWYHTGLDATHPWQSPAISWPLDWRPVWFYVDYQPDKIANIFALGNPVIFWTGFLAVFFTLGYFWISKQKNLKFLLLAYFIFWLPWIVSPRCMFLYHYLPAVPFLSIILAFFLDTLASAHKYLKFLPLLFIVITLGIFIFFYPYWTGISMPKSQVAQYQWLPSWK